MSRQHLARLVAVTTLVAACIAPAGAGDPGPLKAVHPDRGKIVYHRVRPAGLTVSDGPGPLKAVHPDRCEIVYHRVRPAAVNGVVRRPTRDCVVQPSPDR